LPAGREGTPRGVASTQTRRWTAPQAASRGPARSGRPACRRGGLREGSPGGQSGRAVRESEGSPWGVMTRVHAQGWGSPGQARLPPEPRCERRTRSPQANARS
jgi:hypothetical protein